MSISLERLNVFNNLFSKDQFINLSLRDMASPIKVIDFSKAAQLFNHKVALAIASTVVATCLLLYAFKKVFIDSKSESLDKKINDLSQVLTESSPKNLKPVEDIDSQCLQPLFLIDSNIENVERPANPLLKVINNSSESENDSRPVENVESENLQTKEEDTIQRENLSTPVKNFENSEVAPTTEQELNIENEFWTYNTFIENDIKYSKKYPIEAHLQNRAVEEVCKKKGYIKHVLSFNAKLIFQSEMFIMDNFGFIRKFENNEYKIECNSDDKSQIIEVINHYFSLIGTFSKNYRPTQNYREVARIS